MKNLGSNKNQLSGLIVWVLVLFGSFFTYSSAYCGELVSGKVVDAGDASSMPGVTVMVKGTNVYAITNLNGEFEIEVHSLHAVLVFSYIGYDVVELPLKGKNFHVVKMQPAVTELQETIMVRGYGKVGRTLRKPSVVSSNIIVCDAEYGMMSPTFYNPSIETYSAINESGFRPAVANPLSTFSIDVDKAAYSNVRRFINNGQMPPADAVRIEEMLNYFTYDYPQPANGHPFSVNAEYSDCPWNRDHKLLHIGLQGMNIPLEELPPSNLVFLIDVSGSMSSSNRLPLVKAGFKLLVNNLRSIDNVAIVVYASKVGCVLRSTPGNEKAKIIAAIDALEAGGSTAGGAGIHKAYEIAVKNFIPGGNNRVILATDGDFNVGISNENDLQRFIEDKRKTGVYLTCLGFGMGNYKDSKMEILANKGNGNYAYIDNLQEAQKVFIKEFGGTLFTIAKDVKLQIDFNPSKVQAYRLIGYENRRLKDEDFKDDTKDAGEMGAGHSVTAIYEIIPVGVKSGLITLPEPSKYQNRGASNNISTTNEIATIRVRYKKPDEETGLEFKKVIKDERLALNKTTENYRFSASVAMFGMLLRDSQYKGVSNYPDVVKLATGAREKDDDGYRAEFIRLINAISNLEQLSSNNR